MTDDRLTNVPCNGCRLCCQNWEAIILHPEHGDDLSAYQVAVIHRLTGEDAWMLEQKPNGHCIYLGAHGCEIYENRPALCRDYDCRKDYLSKTRRMREIEFEQGFLNREVLEAGKQRQHTLSGAERRACIERRNAALGG